MSSVQSSDLKCQACPGHNSDNFLGEQKHLQLKYWKLLSAGVCGQMITTPSKMNPSEQAKAVGGLGLLWHKAT